MRSMKETVLVCAVTALLGSTLPLRAQTSNGQANGTVVDASGGVLPGVSVTLTNQGTGIARTVVTNPSGNFVFVNVPPGTYVIGAELSGFKGAQTVPFVVGVNETVNRSLSRGCLPHSALRALRSRLSRCRHDRRLRRPCHPIP